MNRRSFLTALAAPLIAKPTLEEIERLTWKRRFFPGYSPLSVDDLAAKYMRPAMEALAEKIEADLLALPIYKLIAAHALPILEANLFSARMVNRAFEASRPMRGDSVQYRIPSRLLRSR